MEKLRALLVEQEKELIVLREENTRLKGGSDGERRRIKGKLKVTILETFKHISSGLF